MRVAFLTVIVSTLHLADVLAGDGTLALVVTLEEGAGIHCLPTHSSSAKGRSFVRQTEASKEIHFL